LIIKEEIYLNYNDKSCYSVKQGVQGNSTNYKSYLLEVIIT